MCYRILEIKAFQVVKICYITRYLITYKKTVVTNNKQTFTFFTNVGTGWLIRNETGKNFQYTTLCLPQMERTPIVIS